MHILVPMMSSYVVESTSVWTAATKKKYGVNGSSGHCFINVRNDVKCTVNTVLCVNRAVST